MHCGIVLDSALPKSAICCRIRRCCLIGQSASTDKGLSAICQIKCWFFYDWISYILDRGVCLTWIKFRIILFYTFLSLLFQVDLVHSMGVKISCHVTVCFISLNSSAVFPNRKIYYISGSIFHNALRYYFCNLVVVLHVKLFFPFCYCCCRNNILFFVCFCFLFLLSFVCLFCFTNFCSKRI